MNFQDQSELKRKNAKLTDYYENLRSNVFSIFGSTQSYSDSYLGLFFNLDMIIRNQIFTPGSKTMLKPEGEMVSQEKYDNYLTKLQNICTEQGEEGPGNTKPVYESMKSAIQNMSALPAQT